MKTCAYCGRPLSNGYIVKGDLFWDTDECYLAWLDERDQARWAEESSSIKPGEVRDPAHDETPPE